jgi:acyl-coenzyme A thioesterase PaaI-like protein
MDSPADAPTGTERSGIPEVGTDSVPFLQGSGGMFVQALDFSFEVSDDGVSMLGSATFTDTLRSPGSSLVRPSLLATIADCVTGVPACQATAPRLAVTLDIVVRIVADRMDDQLDISAQIIKKGRSTVATEVCFSNATTGDPAALSYLTFMASPRPQDVAPPLFGGMRTTGSMPVAFPDFVGLRVLEPGVAEIELSPFVAQASGTLQGGVVALLGEMAAESLSGGTVLDLDTRYLTAVRVGPARTTAVSLGGGLVRVQVHDVGTGNRLAALVTARVGPSIL